MSNENPLISLLMMPHVIKDEKKFIINNERCERKKKKLNNINLVILMNSMFLGLSISTW